MPYNSTGKKISQFTKGTAITDASQHSMVQNGLNKTFTQEQILNDFEKRYGASLRTYEFEATMVDDNIRLGEYAIVEENNYAFYKVTNEAAGDDDVVLDSGLIATFEFYLKSSSRLAFSTVEDAVSLSLNDGTTADLSEEFELVDQDFLPCETLMNNANSKEGSAKYNIWTLVDYRTFIGDSGWEPDGTGSPLYRGVDHYVGSGTAYVMVLDGESVSPEQFGVTDNSNSSPSGSCQDAFTEALKRKHVKILAGREYNIDGAVEISGDGQVLEGESFGNFSGFNVSDTEYTGNAVQTENFPDTAFQSITLKNIKVVGNRDDFTVSEVNAATGAQGMGFALTVGGSEITVAPSYTLGAGCVFSNGGDYGLYTHVNDIYCSAVLTGQEGIIYDGGYDQKIRWQQSYFAWDSDRDTDYTSTKVSKWQPLATISAGILFFSGSAEVVEMHPSNNRHGYAWATFGRSGDSYRLRFDHAIGEGSAGGVFLASTDDVSGGLLNCHSTRGKYGLALCHILSINNVHIAALNIKVDSQNGYPAADGGTAYGLYIDGDRCQIDSFRVWASGGKADVAAVYIEGEGHNLSGTVYGFETKEDTTDATAVSLGFVTEGCDLDIKVESCGIGLSGASGTTDPGRLKMSFKDMEAEAISSTYAGFLSTETFRISDIYDFDGPTSTKDQLIGTGTIAAANADNSNRSVAIAYSGFFKNPSVKSLFVINRGSSSYNAGGIDLWVAGVTGSTITLKYNIDIYTGDFEIFCLVGHI